MTMGECRYGLKNRIYEIQGEGCFGVEVKCGISRIWTVAALQQASEVKCPGKKTFALPQGCQNFCPAENLFGS